jgi:hypothetical protein
VDVAKQLDERDADYKAEIDQLKGRIAELVDEEQREGQLKKIQELLITSEAEASGAKAELQHLKEQATKWEVDIARLNADLAGKLQILLPLPCSTYSVRHNTNLAGISTVLTYTHIPNIFFFYLRHLPCLC